jgi:hypothetical protein
VENFLDDDVGTSTRERYRNRTGIFTLTTARKYSTAPIRSVTGTVLLLTDGKLIFDPDEPRIKPIPTNYHVQMKQHLNLCLGPNHKL